MLFTSRSAATATKNDNSFFQPRVQAKNDPASETAEQDTQAGEVVSTEKTASVLGGETPFFAPKPAVAPAGEILQLKEREPESEAEATPDVQMKPEMAGAAATPDPENEEGVQKPKEVPVPPGAHLVFDPQPKEHTSEGAAESQHKSDITSQMEMETRDARNNLSMDAQMEEGKPTVLGPKNEEERTGEPIELKNEGNGIAEAAPGAAVEAAQPAAPAPPAVPAASGETKAGGDEEAQNEEKEGGDEPAEAGELAPAAELVQEALAPPAAEPDPNVAAITTLNAATPEEADLEAYMQDPRSDAEKRAEQAGYVNHFAQEVQAATERVRASVEGQVSTIQSAKQVASEQLIAQTQSATQELQAHFAAQRAQLTVQFELALVNLQTSKAADLAAADALQQEKTTALTTALTARKTAFSAFVTEQKQQPYVLARAEADRADRELDAAAADCRRQGNEVASRYPGDEDGNADARAAVHELANTSSADILEKKPAIREDVLARAADFDGSFGQYEADTQQQIDAIEQQLVPGIADAMAQYKQQVETAYSGIETSLRSALDAAMQTLTTQEQDSTQQLQTQQRQGLQALETTAATAIESLRSNGEQLTTEIAQLGQNVAALLAPGEGLPNLPEIRALFDENLVQLQQLETDGNANLQLFTDTAQSEFDAIVAASSAETDSLKQGIFAGTAALLATTTASLAQIISNVALQMTQSRTAITQGLDQMRDEALSGLDTSIEERKGKITQATTEFGTSLREEVDKSIEKAKQPLLDLIIDRLLSASYKARASWWEGMLLAIADFLLVLIVVVAIAALLVAVGVFSSIATALLVIGLVVLALVFIVSLVSHLASGHGWASILYALGEATGVTAIYEAVTNRDIVTGENKNASIFDRWFSGTTGVLQVITLVTPLKSRIPGLRRITLPELPGWARFVKWVETQPLRPRPRIVEGPRVEVPVETPAETPVETPETPVDTPETPVETPETPVDTPETPVDTPETPVDTPETPVDTPETPVDTPETPIETETPVEPPELSGRRPPVPERPVLDESGALTEYGRWYYEKPGAFRNRSALEQNVWDNAASTGEGGVVRDPVTGEPIDPSNWRLEEVPERSFETRQLEAAQQGKSRSEFLDDFNDPRNYRPRQRSTPAEFSGPRPETPQQPTIDPSTGELTDYGKWYYERPSGYREGVRDAVWDNAQRNSIDGKVRDPLTGQEMLPDEPWDMGHRYGFEFWKHRLSAATRRIGRTLFIDEYNVPDHYRPELPSSNHGHQGEAPPGVYYGD